MRCLRSHLAFLYSSIFFINSIFLAALPIPLPASSVWVRYGREIICRTLSAPCSRNLAFRFICRVIFLTLRCLPIHCSPGVLRLLNRIKFSNINMMLNPQLKFFDISIEMIQNHVLHVTIGNHEIDWFLRWRYQARRDVDI